METLSPVLIGVFVFIVVHFSYNWFGDNGSESLQVTHIARQAIEAAHADPDLPEFIKKDRTVEYRHQWEWKQQWVSLLQVNCTKHYGKDRCNDCETYDHNVPVGCDCDMIYQRNIAGEMCLRFRAPNDNCKHHSKEHHFA